MFDKFLIHDKIYQPQPRKICVKPYCVEGLGIKERRDIGVAKDILWLDWGRELASNPQIYL
jgi:hypothetical protein